MARVFRGRVANSSDMSLLDGRVVMGASGLGMSIVCMFMRISSFFGFRLRLMDSLMFLKADVNIKFFHVRSRAMRGVFRAYFYSVFRG